MLLNLKCVFGGGSFFFLFLNGLSLIQHVFLI